MIFHGAAEVFLDQEVEHDVTKAVFLRHAAYAMQYNCCFRQSYGPNYNVPVPDMVGFLQDVLRHPLIFSERTVIQDYLWVAREYLN